MSFSIPAPSHWNLVKLSDLGEVNRGRSRHRPRDAAHLYGGIYPFIQTGDIKASEGRVLKYTQTYSDAGLAQSRLWPAGTMCITIAANIAETGILQFPACFPDSVIGFIPDETKCDVYFIEYIFRLLKRRIQAQATGSVQDNINLQTLEKIEFPIPELNEQKRIAGILRTLDDKIQLNHQINQTLESIVQAIFKSWFVDFDPVKAKIEVLENGGSDEEVLLAAMRVLSSKSEEELAEFEVEKPGEYAQLRETAGLFPSAMVESELGEVPEGWEVKPFSDWATVTKGKNITKAKAIPGEIPVVAGGLEPAYYHNEFNVEGPAITISASGANAGYVNMYYQNIWSSDSSYINKQSTPYFYTAYVFLKYSQKAIFDMQTGAAQPHIYPRDFDRLYFIVANEKLLNIFEKQLIGYFEYFFNLKKENNSLANLRDTLLPKLLSGELDVSEMIGIEEIGV